MTPSTERPVAVEASTRAATADIVERLHIRDAWEKMSGHAAAAPTLQEAADTIAALRAQVAELEQDAKRLDWVLPILDGCGNNDVADARALLIGMWLLRGKSGRELIDSAMKE